MKGHALVDGVEARRQPLCEFRTSCWQTGNDPNAGGLSICSARKNGVSGNNRVAVAENLTFQALRKFMFPRRSTCELISWQGKLTDIRRSGGLELDEG